MRTLKQDGIEKVHYAGLKSHPQHELACRQMTGFGGMISLDLKTDLAGARRFLEAVKIFALAESLNFREWSGYYAVSAYEAHHEHEYNAIRNAAALIDISPLYKYRVSGPDATRLVALQRAPQRAADPG